MTKEEIVTSLVTRIKYNVEQRDYYAGLVSTSATPEIWAEMTSWYEGRICAFRIVIEMIDPKHEEAP